jgi:hypothetical protein
MTARELWTLLHGMGFGGLYLLACSGAIVELWRRYVSREAPIDNQDLLQLNQGAAKNECENGFRRMRSVAADAKI